MDEIIAAIKRLAARARKMALWPLAMLTARLIRANRKMIRWAIRHRSRSVYLFAILWSPTTITALLVWGLVSVPSKPDPHLSWPIIGVAVVLIKKAMAFAVYLMEEGDRVARNLRHYRRAFASRLDPVVGPKENARD